TKTKIEGKIGLAGIYYLEFLVNGEKNKRTSNGKILEIQDLGYTNEYVYDIETGNGHYGAGIGEIIVHNTDSSMPNLGLKDPKTAYKEAHQWAKELTQLFPKPMELE